MTKLLIKEPPLQVLPSLAVQIGLNEAIVLQQLHYWLENPKVGFEKNGMKWIANTYDEWQFTNFPFWSTSTIKRIFGNLEDSGIVLSDKFEVSDWNQRKAYTIAYGLIDEVNLTHSSGSKRSTLNKNTENTTENKEIPQNMPIEWYLQHDLPVPEHLTENNRAEREALDNFEQVLGFGSLPWDSTREWKNLSKFVVSKYQSNERVWRDYQTWRNGKGKYDAMSNKQIRLKPEVFIDTGFPAFEAYSVMYAEDEKPLRML